MRAAEIMKRAVLLQYAERFNTKVFVETGTYKGDTVKAMLMSKKFSEIHSIEVYEDRAKNAQQRFAPFPSVFCYHGDSAQLMPDIVRNISEPTLFWLDAHHSGKQIARVKGLIETPLISELDTILRHPYLRQHVILIDDARYYNQFGGKYPGYPTEAQIQDMVMAVWPECHFEISDDILRIHADHETTR